MKLYSWQQEALEELKANRYRGIVVATTGSGKTRFALEVFKLLKQRTLIVVPTKALLDQWTNALHNVGVKENDLGRYYATEKNFRKVTIATIHSIKDMTTLNKKFSLVIYDEIHRYGASTWKKFLLNNRFKYSIGLTATLEREDGNHDVLLKSIGKVVYDYTPKDAVEDKLLNEFTIYNVGLMLGPSEKARLSELDEKIKKGMSRFDDDFNRVLAAIKNGNRYAGKILSDVSKRKKFYNNNSLKVKHALRVVEKALNENKKIIVFGEYIQTADELYKQLRTNGHENLYVYYSGNKSSIFNLTPTEKQDVLSDFKKSDSGALITVKALDEGLDIKDLDVGVMLGYNKTSRQAIQRMGRILRKVEKKHPEMYIFYFKGTADYWNAKKFAENFSDIGDIKWI